MNIVFRGIYGLILGVVAASAALAGPHDSPCQEQDKSFREFVAKFADDKEFQVRRTIFPLVARFGVLDFAPPDIELWGTRTVQDFKTPIFLSRAERKRRGIEQQIPVATEQYAEVFHFKPEADSYRVLFSFRNYRGCWYLEQLHDTAL